VESDFKEAVDFINNMSRPFELGYSAVNDCLVVRRIEDGEVQVVAAFIPAELNAMVRTRVIDDEVWVSLEGFNSAAVITTYSVDDGKLWRTRSGTFAFRISDDNDDAPRVARALSTLLTLMGARATRF
jgi:hypothetical protein